MTEFDFRYCPSCAEECRFEAPAGCDAAERACVECGCALLVDPPQLPPVALPVRHAA